MQPATKRKYSAGRMGVTVVEEVGVRMLWAARAGNRSREPARDMVIMLPR